MGIASQRSVRRRSRTSRRRQSKRTSRNRSSRRIRSPQRNRSSRRILGTGTRETDSWHLFVGLVPTHFTMPRIPVHRRRILFDNAENTENGVWICEVCGEDDEGGILWLFFGTLNW